MRHPAFKKGIASLLALACTAVFGVPASFAFTINAGDTMTVESSAGNPYNYSTAGNIIINGTLQGFEKTMPGGALTGNGATINLTSTAGTITLGSTGRIIINGTIIGGNGGILVLDASSIFINGIIQANGLGAGGGGGTITINTDALNMASTASVSALSGQVNALGGVIDINSSGLVTISSGAQLSTKGASGVSNNLIDIQGAGVNISGVLNAQSRGTADGGTIILTATDVGNQVNIGSTGQLIAAGYVNNDGGSITITGNATNQGVINASAGSGNRTGGSVVITGAANRQFTNSGNGRIYALGQSSAAASNGGTITINTGTVTLNQVSGGIKIDSSGSKLSNGTGNGGAIDIRATSGDLDATYSIMRNYGRGGSIVMRSNTGDVNIGNGGNIVTYGDNTNTFDVQGANVTVNGIIGSEGIHTYDAGSLTINASGDFTLNNNGYLTTRASEHDTTNTGSNGGTITVNATDVTLNGAAKMRAYGTQYMGGGDIGNGGVIDINASGDYTAGSNVILNAGGARVYTGPTITQNVIDITANNMDIDGRYLAHGRNDAQDGGRISFTANNLMTLRSTASLEAWGDLDLGGAGGAIYLQSLTGNINILNGAMLSSAGVLGNMGGIMNVAAANDVTFASNILDASGSVGGNIDIDAGNTINFGGSQFLASGTAGSGGLIQMVSGGVMTVDASSVYNSSGTAAGGQMVFEGSDVNNNATLTSNNGDITLRATTGDVTTNATYNSDDIQLNAANGNVIASGTFNGLVSSNAESIVITANSGNLNTDTVTSTAGNTTLTASNGNLTTANGGTVSSTGALSMESGTGNLTTNSALTGTSINLTANNGNISGTQGSYSGGAITATGRTIGLTSTAGSMQLGNLTATAGNVNINANAGGLTLLAGQTIDSSGNTILRAGTGSLSSNNTTFNSGGVLDLSANGAITVNSNNQLNVGSLRIYGAGGTGSAAGAVAVTETTGNLNVSLLNTNTSSSLVASDVGSALTLSNATIGGGTLTMQADTAITATTNNQFAGAIQAYGNTGVADHVAGVNITSIDNTNDLNVTQLTATNSNLTATTGNAGVRLSNLDSNNGTTTINASRNITLTNNTIDGTDTLRATSVNNQTVALTGNTVANDITGRTSLPGGTSGVYIGSAGNYNLAGNTVTGDVDISTNNNISMASGSIGGVLTASADNINVTADTGDLTSGIVTATTGGVSLTATNGNLTTTGATSSVGATTLTSGSGDIVVNATVYGEGGITTRADGAGGDITLNASLDSRNSSGVGQDVVVSANRNVTITGANDIFADGRVQGANGGTIDITATTGTFSMMGGTGATLRTTGQADGSHNIINITANTIELNSRLYADGDNWGTAGSAGGQINLTSTGGDINLSAATDLYARGRAASVTNPGNGGAVTINSAADYIQGGQIFTNVATSTNQGLGGANYGGDVSIVSGGNMVFNFSGANLINTRGANYGSGNLYNGGDGGSVTLNSVGNLTFNNSTANTNPKYFMMRGGRGRGAGNVSGNGGILNMNHSGSLSIDNYNAGQPWRNFDVRAGQTGNGATVGIQGNIFDNGALVY